MNLKTIIGRMYREIRQRGYYILGSIYAELNGTGRKSRKYLRECKDIHKGKRAFIIGNGPSLTKEDLEMLTNEITFASNRIYKMFDDTEWRPKYFTISDDGVARSGGAIEGINSFDCDMKFIRKEGYLAYKNMKKPLCAVHMWWSRKYLDRPNFSENAEKGIYAIATVTYFSLQLAVHMGIREIYLIGVDHNYGMTQLKDGTIITNPDVRSYGWSMSKEEKNVVGASWEMEVAYNYAKKYGEEYGIKIYNATRGGHLEVFERVNLDSLF